MSNRKQKLAHMKKAGFDNDRAKWTKLFVENRISRDAAETAWKQGENKRRDYEAT